MTCMREARRAASIECSRERLRRVEARGIRSSCSSRARSSAAGSIGPADHATRSPWFIRSAKATASVILGTSFFTECGDPFGEIAAPADSISEFPLQGFPAGSVLGNAGADLGLHRLDRGWAIRRNLDCAFEGRRHDVCCRQHPIDQADAGCELSGYETPAEQQVHGMHIANLLHELHGGPTEGVNRPLHLWQAKACMFRCKPDVGRQQEFDATPGA